MNNNNNIHETNKRRNFLNQDGNEPYFKFGAPMDYCDYLSNSEFDKVLALSDYDYDSCVVNAQDVALGAIKRMMGSGI